MGAKEKGMVFSFFFLGLFMGPFSSISTPACIHQHHPRLRAAHGAQPNQKKKKETAPPPPSPLTISNRRLIILLQAVTARTTQRLPILILHRGINTLHGSAGQARARQLADRLARARIFDGFDAVGVEGTHVDAVVVVVVLDVAGVVVEVGGFAGLAGVDAGAGGDVVDVAVGVAAEIVAGVFAVDDDCCCFRGWGGRRRRGRGWGRGKR